MGYVYSPGSHKQNKLKKSGLIALVVAFSVALIAGFVWWTFIRIPSFDNSSESTYELYENEQQEEVEEESPTDTFQNIQPVVDDWVASHPGTYSIYIIDRQGNILAKHDENQVFFAASLYKLYVAYEGYRKIDDGTYSLQEEYLNGKTRGYCLDSMIRDSNSACGEKMMAELGQNYLTTKMEEYGLKNTSLSGIQTTASDSSAILQKVYLGVGLTSASRESYLDSMKTQDDIYRRGLPSGFANSVVFNKVGWNLDQEWHDASIVELSDGRVVIVSVLTTNAGYKNIAGFGQALEQAL